MKKKTLVPLIIFFVGICLVGFIAYQADSRSKEQRRITAQLNAEAYGERIKNEITNGIAITDTLQQVLISQNGKFDHFDTIANNIISDSIESVQLAPDGIVTVIYPATGNEVGKIDLIHDKDRGRISCYARDNHTLITQGPFELKQSSYGIAVRNPIYLKNANGQEYFWGFTIAILRVPDIFSDSISALSNFGYEYKLSKTASPWDNTYEVVCQSNGQIISSVSYDFTIGEENWKFEVMPKSGWGNVAFVAVIIGFFTSIVLIMSCLTWVWLSSKENKNKFQTLAHMDSLTNIYNRYGFDELVEKMIAKNPKSHFVVALLDIDDFKFINDIYGHAYGDKALKNLADSMKNFFPSNALLGRNGGDEFCIFLPDCTCKEAEEKLVQFTKQKRFFVYEGEERAFNISLGYAEYPVHAKSQLQLMHCADAALYEVKLRGKKGSLVYDEGFDSEVRTQLGFALRDISENLPGAFIIYKADYTDDEILFANSELIRLAGCENIEEFMTYTQRSFRSLIREDEREGVEQSIWQQIGTGQCNDYVHFYLKKKDGTYLKVLDHGRIVESGHYGKVFYVLIMDWDSMKEKYRDSL